VQHQHLYGVRGQPFTCRYQVRQPQHVTIKHQLSQAPALSCLLSTPSHTISSETTHFYHSLVVLLVNMAWSPALMLPLWPCRWTTSSRCCTAATATSTLPWSRSCCRTGFRAWCTSSTHSHTTCARWAMCRAASHTPCATLAQPLPIGHPHNAASPA
jgi:hypothetical protein